MGRFLICCTPVQGHVGPLLRISDELCGRDHEVVVLTGSRFADAVTAVGARHVALPPECDYDDRDLDTAFPERASKRGPGKLNFDVARLFADPIPHQYRALEELYASFGPQAVLTDTLFCGAAVWKLAEVADRPPVAAACVTPLTIRSPGVPPFGLGLAPRTGPLGRVRDSIVGVALDSVVLRPARQRINEMFEATAGRRLPGSFLDGPLLADCLLVMTVPSFEYPRPNLPDKARFIGPVLPPPSDHFEPPEWWDELDGTRPVVHVTQGTLDTADLGRLIAPTLAALADDDVLVVAATGGRPTSAVPGSVPANARIERFLPYDHLLDKVDLMVTNGGYGGVQYALSHGVPLVAAGDSEDKPEVAARIAWAGAGINLRTGRPRPAKIRNAVGLVLTEPSFRHRARTLQAEMTRYDGARAATDVLEQLATVRL